MAFKREAKEQLHDSFEKHAVIQQSLQVDQENNAAAISSETDDKILAIKSLETNFRKYQQKDIIKKRAREAKQELYRYYALSKSGVGIGEGGKSKYEIQQKSQQLESMLQSNVKISEEEIAKLFKFKQNMSSQAFKDQARVSSQDKIKTAKRKNESKLQTISSQGRMQKWQMQRKETEYLNWSLKQEQQDLRLQRMISPNTQSDIQSDYVSPKQSFGQVAQPFTKTPKQLLTQQEKGQFASKSQSRKIQKHQMQKRIIQRMAIADIQNIGQSSKIILGPTHLTKDEIREAQYYHDIIQYRQAMSPAMNYSFDKNAAHSLIQRPSTQSKVQGNRNFHSIDYTLNNERSKFLPMSYERELVHKLIEVQHEKDQIDIKESTNRIQALPSGQRCKITSQEDAESVYMPSQRFNFTNKMSYRGNLESTNRKRERLNSMSKQVELGNESPGADTNQLSIKNMIPIDIKPIVMESMASFKLKQTAKKQAAKMEQVSTLKKQAEIEKVNSKDEIKSIEVQVDINEEQPTIRQGTNRTILSVEQITHRSPINSLRKNYRDQADDKLNESQIHQLGHIFNHSKNTSAQQSQLKQHANQNKDLLHLDFENSFLHITQKDIHSKWKTIADEKKQQIAFGTTTASQPQRNLSINTRLESQQSPDTRENTQVHTALKQTKGDDRTGSQITQEKMTEQGKSRVSHQLQPQFQPSLKQIINQELTKSQKDGSRTLEPTLEKVGSQQPVQNQVESTAMFQEYPKTLSPLSSAGQEQPRKKDSDMPSFGHQLQYNHAPVKHEGVTLQVRKLGQRMTMGLNGAQGMSMMNVPVKPRTSHQMRRTRDILRKHNGTKLNNDIGFHALNIKREGSTIVTGEAKVGSMCTSGEKLQSYKGTQVHNIKPILFNSTIDHLDKLNKNRDQNKDLNFNLSIVAKTPSLYQQHIEDAHSNINPICLVDEDVEELSPGYKHTLQAGGSLIQTSGQETVIPEPFENKSIQAIHDEIEEFENFGSTHDEGFLKPSVSRRNSEQYLIANGKFEKRISNPIVETNRQDNTFETLSAESANKKEGQYQKDCKVQTPKMNQRQSDFHQKELQEIHKSLVPQQLSSMTKQVPIPTNSQIDKSIKRIIGSKKLTEVKRMDNTQQKRAKVIRNMGGLRKSQYKQMINEVTSIAAQQPELFPINSPSVFNISNILPQMRENIISQSPRTNKSRVQALQTIHQKLSTTDDLAITKIQTQNIQVSLRHSSQDHDQLSKIQNNDPNISQHIQEQIDAEFLGIQIHKTEQSLDMGKASTPMQVEVHSKSQYTIKKNERRSSVRAGQEITLSDELNRMTKSDEQKSTIPDANVSNIKYILSHEESVNNKGDFAVSPDSADRFNSATQNSFMYSRRVLSSKLSPLGPQSCSPTQKDSSRALVEKKPTNDLLQLICQRANLSNRKKVRSPQQVNKNVDLEVYHGLKTSCMKMTTLPISEKSLSKTLENQGNSDTLIAEDLNGEHTASYSKSPEVKNKNPPQPQRRVVNSTMSQLAKEKLHEISLAQNFQKIPIEMNIRNNESQIIDAFETTSRKIEGPNISKRKYSANSDTQLKENLSDSKNEGPVDLEIPGRGVRNDTEPIEPSVESPFNLRPKNLISGDLSQNLNPVQKTGLEFKIHKTQLEKPPQIKRKQKDKNEVLNQDKVLVIINEKSNDIQQMGKLLGMSQNQQRDKALPKQNQQAVPPVTYQFMTNESAHRNKQKTLRQPSNERARVSTIPYIKDKSLRKYQADDFHGIQGQHIPTPYSSMMVSPKTDSVNAPTEDSLLQYIQQNIVQQPQPTPKIEEKKQEKKNSTIATLENVPRDRGSILIDERDEFQLELEANQDAHSSGKGTSYQKSRKDLELFKHYITPPLSTIKQGPGSGSTSSPSQNTNSITFAMKPKNLLDSVVQSAFI